MAYLFHTKSCENIEAVKVDFTEFFVSETRLVPSRDNSMYVYLGLRARNEMIMDDYGGQMIFGDLVGLKLPDIRVTDEEKPRKNLTQETCPDRGSNPGPLRERR